MSSVAVRELRNRTADVVRRVEAGETVTLTNRGREVARIVPVVQGRKPYLTREEFLAIPKMDAAVYDELKAYEEIVGPLE